MGHTQIICGLALCLGAALSPAAQAPSLGSTYYPQSFSQNLVPDAPDRPQTITIVAVGDVLLHTPLQRQAAAHPNGFRSLWTDVEPWLQRADIAYANLEGPVALGLTRSGRTLPDPGNIFDNAVHTSYPLFNYPDRLVFDLKDSGIDVVSTANNHALDRGSKGVDATLGALFRAGLPSAGTVRSDAPNAEKIWHTLVPTPSGTLAFVACSFSTNGLADPKHQVLGCHSDKDLLLDVVRTLSRQPQITAVIVTPHWGVEYTPQPTHQDKHLAHDLIDAGAAAVLGAHPHVPQPWATHTAPDGRVGVIVYSMGNFVSGQFQRLQTRSAVLITLTLTVGQSGRAVPTSARYLPLEMTRSSAGYAVRPIDGTWQHTPAIMSHLHNLFGPVNQDLLLPLAKEERSGLP